MRLCWKPACCPCRPVPAFSPHIARPLLGTSYLPELSCDTLICEHTVFHTCKQLSALRRSILWQMRFIPIRRYLSAEIRSSSNASGPLSGKTPENVEAVLTGGGRGGGGK